MLPALATFRANLAGTCYSSVVGPSESPMFVEPVAGAIVGKLWDERRLIGAFVKDFCDLMIKGGLKIFVFGCAGTGKTTFGKIVEDHENMARLSGEYSLSAEMEMYGLEGKHFVQISIPPGQEAFRTRQWGQLLNALSDARRAVVVNIVCWGFHSLERDELRRVPEFAAGLSTQATQQFL